MSESKGRYRAHPSKPDFGYKVFEVPAANSPSGVAERWVVTRNERDRERQLEKIAEHVARVKRELARKPGPGMAHAKASCAVASHVSLKKYVTPSAKVRGIYVLDQEAVAREKLLSGVRTTKLDWDGLELLSAYQRLQNVEDKHKEYKSVLELRPCYHRAERRIRAHVLLTVLAANIAYTLEKRSGRSLAELKSLFGAVSASEIKQGGKHYWQRSELTAEHEAVLKAVGARVPAPVWSEWIEPVEKPKTRMKKGSR